MDTVRLSHILKALSHPNRLELYLEIAKHTETCHPAHAECYIFDAVMQSLNIGAPTISHHLKELSNAGLIHTHRKGKFLVATINRATVQEVRELLSF